MMENTLLVSTTSGGGNHGHLALVTLPAVYQTMVGTIFSPPINPDPVPVPIPVPTRQLMTNVKINQLKETH
eukprot:2581110-Ditylum_brightwellii.AAC.1